MHFEESRMKWINFSLLSILLSLIGLTINIQSSIKYWDFLNLIVVPRLFVGQMHREMLMGHIEVHWFQILLHICSITFLIVAFTKRNKLRVWSIALAFLLFASYFIAPLMLLYKVETSEVLFLPY